MELKTVSLLLYLIKYYLSLKVRFKYPLFLKTFPPGGFICLVPLFSINFVSSSSYIIHYNLLYLSPAPLMFLIGRERELNSSVTWIFDCIPEYLSLRGKCILRTLKPNVYWGPTYSVRCIQIGPLSFGGTIKHNITSILILPGFKTSDSTLAISF